LDRAAHCSEGRDLFLIAPLARTQSERSRRLALATGFGSQTVWNKSNRCAGERGGARAGRPRWLRILTITGGSSMAAMIFKLPPQFGQCSMSMSKTRLSKRAQLRKILLSGYTPLYLYEHKMVDTSLPFDELKRRSHINAAGQAADQAADFSQRIRMGLPNPPKLTLR